MGASDTPLSQVLSGVAPGGFVPGARFILMDWIVPLQASHTPVHPVQADQLTGLVVAGSAARGGRADLLGSGAHTRAVTPQP